MQTSAETLPPTLIEPVVSPSTMSLMAHQSQRVAQFPRFGLVVGREKAGVFR